MIESLAQFYSQKFHVPINVTTSDRMPDNNLGAITLAYPLEEPSPDFWTGNHGKPVLREGTPIAMVGENYLALLLSPDDELVGQLIDEHLPGLCLKARMQQCSAYLGQMKTVVDDCREKFKNAIRSDQYELDDLIRQSRELARKLVVSSTMLKFYENADAWLKRKGLRMFAELRKLVPGLYASFRFENATITGVTQPITIRHEGHAYHFAPYSVSVNLMASVVSIEGKTNNRDGYIHPHISGNSVCWGSLGPLIEDLLAKVELPGLFLAIQQFLSSYNESDPYQKIQYWDPDFDPEDDEFDEDQPYCTFCDESGHDVAECPYSWWCEDCETYHDNDDVCPKEKQYAEAV